jgi:hypothetical protein
MRILDMLRKNYKNSAHPEIYEEIAAMFDATPQHVFKLAHGKKPRNQKDDRIITQLIIKGIVR